MVKYQLEFSPALDDFMQTRMAVYLMGDFTSVRIMRTRMDDDSSTADCYLDSELTDEHIGHLRKEFNLTDYDVTEYDVTDDSPRLRSLIEEEE